MMYEIPNFQAFIAAKVERLRESYNEAKEVQRTLDEAEHRFIYRMVDCER